jgi:hypothetical protein
MRHTGPAQLVRDVCHSHVYLVPELWLLFNCGCYFISVTTHIHGVPKLTDLSCHMPVRSPLMRSLSH